MKKHYNLTTTEDNGKSITTTNTSSEYPEEIVRLLALAGQGMPQVAPAPAEDNCGCGQTPCMSAEATVDEDAEYKPTPANDELDLDDFSKKTANSISRQKKTLKPSAGDNPLEYSVNEEEIYDALMADAQEFGLVDESFSDQVKDFGMFTRGGNAQVQNIIQYVLDDFADEAEDASNSERDSLRMDALKTMFQELEDLATDEKHAEADDTEVRERAAAYLDQGIIRIMNMLDKQ
jgi:hypothetical protein